MSNFFNPLINDLTISLFIFLVMCFSLTLGIQYWVKSLKSEKQE